MFISDILYIALTFSRSFSDLTFNPWIDSLFTLSVFPVIDNMIVSIVIDLHVVDIVAQTSINDGFVMTSSIMLLFTCRTIAVNWFTEYADQNCSLVLLVSSFSRWRRITFQCKEICSWISNQIHSLSEETFIMVRRS